MQSTELLHEDYKNQLASSETEIAENTAMLARIEPGFWVRAITGWFFFVLEIALYLFILILLWGAIWLYANLFSATFNVSSNTSVTGTVNNDQLDAVRYFITGIFLLGALVTFLFARFIRNARKNLFKLADAATYLEKTLAARKARRDKVVGMLVEMGKE